MPVNPALLTAHLTQFLRRDADSVTETGVLPVLAHHAAFPPTVTRTGHTTPFRSSHRVG
jgi:hypothetical protein